MRNFTIIDYKRFNNLSKQQMSFLILIDVNYNGLIDNKGKITNNNEKGRIARIIKLNQPLHIKGQEFIKIDTFYLKTQQKPLMLSSKDLILLAYIKVRKKLESTIKYLSNKFNYSFSTIIRILKKLSLLKLISNKFTRNKSINGFFISRQIKILNSTPPNIINETQEKHKILDPPPKIEKEIEEESWEEIEEALGRKL